METLGYLNGYQIDYLDARQQPDWVKNLPLEHWLLFVVIKESDPAVFELLTAECLPRQPLSICCAGSGAAELEDWFDMEIVGHAVAWEELHQQPFAYEYAPVTTAHPDIAAGFWFATLHSPAMCVQPVKRIVCIDTTGAQRAQLRKLLHLIKQGWLPPDNPTDD